MCDSLDVLIVWFMSRQLFESCGEENNNIVKEALYLKAQVVAGVDKGKITKDIKLSSQDILTRMLQKAEHVVEEVRVTALFI